MAASEVCSVPAEPVPAVSISDMAALVAGLMRLLALVLALALALALVLMLEGAI